jgi:hypothetical protein
MTDLINHISGVSNSGSFTAGSNTPPTYGLVHTGAVDGTNSQNATKNMAEIYNRMFFVFYYLVKQAGLTEDFSNWAQPAQAVKKLVDDSNLNINNQISSINSQLSTQNGLITGLSDALLANANADVDHTELAAALSSLTTAFTTLNTNTANSIYQKLYLHIPLISVRVQTIDISPSNGTATVLNTVYGINADGSQFNKVTLASVTMEGDGDDFLFLNLNYNDTATVSALNAIDKMHVRASYTTIVGASFEHAVASCVFDESGRVRLHAWVPGQGVDVTQSQKITYAIDIYRLGVW